MTQFPSRRQFVGLGCAALLAGCAHPRVGMLVKQPATPGLDVDGRNSLAAHAAVRGCLFGCAVDIRFVQRDESYAHLVREQSAILVAENSMKWDPMRPTSTTYFFDDADALISYAEANHKKVRGHNLCWHRQLPAWFAAEATSQNAPGLLRSHIETVAGRYAGRMHSWDVVNEAVLISDGRADGLRKSPWLELIGEEYIEQAFRAAREADPQALLAYNDYGIEGEDEGSRKKRAAVLQLLRRLKTRHVPLDALGIQAHIEAGASYGAGLRDFMREVRELGLQIFITEMDVNDRKLPANEAGRDKAVAETYRSFLELVLREPAVRVVLTWGITDRKTWLNGEDAREDHLPERCLPFGLVDGKIDSPKPAFFAMRDAFDGRVVPATPKRSLQS